MSSNSFIEPLPINVFGSILSTRLVWTIYGVEPAVFTKLVSSLRDSSLSALVSFLKLFQPKELSVQLQRYPYQIPSVIVYQPGLDYFFRSITH